MDSTAGKLPKAYPDAFKANVKMPPMGHYGDVEKEIGRACIQLASPVQIYVRRNYNFRRQQWDWTIIFNCQYL